MKTFIDDIKKMDKNQLVLLAAQLKKENLLSQKTTPIAVVGMGAKFPGQTEADLNSFWQMVLDGKNCVNDITDKRWSNEQFFSDDFDAPGKTYVNKMALLEQFDLFDAPFFNIHKGEADLMDPQQRWLLEVCWHTFEDAGIDPQKIKGQCGGVYVGLMNHDYVHLQNLKQNLNRINGYSALGSSMSVAAGRIAYFYGLTGPSYAIDTACSSSLVSVHEACQALRNQECEFALAGGVNAILSPTTTIAESKAMMLSPSGTCHTYDAAADGYVRGEGCGMLLLKRLSDAKRDGNKIYAVIKGSAINQDGASQGLTAPNGPSQTQVIKAALAHAQVETEDVGFIETHGTGTPLGDPIEIQAICEAYETRLRQNTLNISSLKTNIGHTESAAGIAGLIKLILARYHGVLPQHNHLNQLSEHIKLEDHALEILQNNKKWQPETPYGAISSFGFSGTNAHMIVGPAPQRKPAVATKKISAHASLPQILLSSAKSPEALQNINEKWQTLINTQSNDLFQKAINSQQLRSHFELRTAWVLPPQSSQDSPIKIPSSRASQGKVCWLLTGQGSQYFAMGKTLYDSNEVFKATMDQCINAFDQLDFTTISLRSILFSGDESLIHHTQYTQPAIYALQVALIHYWQSLELKPDYLIGHSVGEYAAAYCAQVFSLEVGMQLIATRGHLMASLCDKSGAMVAVSCSHQQALHWLDDFHELSIAANNGLNSIVIAGASQAIESFIALLKEQSIRHKKLNVSQGFHSPLMQPMLNAFKTSLDNVNFNDPQIPIISTLKTDNLVTDQHYWLEHVSATVEFYAAIEQAQTQQTKVWLEIGPGNTLVAMARQCIEDSKEAHHWISSLNATDSNLISTYQAIGQLFVAGKSINWSLLTPHIEPDQSVDLPLYNFERQRYWFEKAAVFQLSEQNHGLNKSTSNLTDNLNGDLNKNLNDYQNSLTKSKLLTQLESMNQEEQWLQLVSMTRQSIGEVLNRPEEEIPVDVDLFDLGLDSMKAMDMRSQVQKTLGYQLSATLLFDYPNVIKLVDYFGIELLKIWDTSPVEEELQET